MHSYRLYLNSSKNYSILLERENIFESQLGSRAVFSFPKSHTNKLNQITILQNNEIIFEGYILYENSEKPSKFKQKVTQYSIFGSIILLIVSSFIFVPYLVYKKVKKQSIERKVLIQLLIIITLLTIICTSVIANLFSYAYM